MNLLQFREFFREQSGRYDLVTATFADNGADNLINAGQRYLDRLVDIPAGIGRYFIDISAGDALVKFTDCRAVLEAWCIGENSNGEIVRTPLTKYTQAELRGINKKTLEAGYTEMFSEIDQARPLYYTVSQLRMVNKTGGGIGGLMDVVATGHQTYNGLVLMPPSDSDYSIEVVGHFYSAELSADDDSTFWTEQHPTLLYAATMREIEKIHRNTAGRADWEQAIQADIVTIDMDGVAEESAGVNRMEG